ncbi:microcystin LR degradation protein MlrC-like protein [Achromobacter insolitus]|uniref:M81 family metallopeptidase n=1 Tax=Achromobacter TaxID=222 RepID=UPI0007C8739E|nr:MULTISPECIES: M81 family metallopeptidase [Achromobacter]MEB3095933.1 M81 family metallopeptidase [Achromobacter sp. D10]OAE64554.1 microcystin LR degradation protein MlrC-like protein [Achromobacter insolitus]OCZ60083.1 microcystin LR degradation protein MlrC-like protein [Achromobacter insolitus]
MKIFSGSLATETNTFSPIPTGLSAYRARGYYPAGQHPDRMQMFSGPLWAARQRAQGKNWTLIEGLTAGATPAGITTRHAYETLRDELLGDLKRAGKVDIALFGLHGAMVADGYDDCEGDLLRRAREIVGPDAVIGAELDPHCHMTADMMESADFLVCFKEYPHTDILERAYDLVDLCVARAEGRIKPTRAVYDCEMISIMHTSREPMRGFVDRLLAMEGKEGVLSVSIAHGFPWGDTPDMGSKVLVYTDGDQAQADALARALGEEIIGFRDQLAPPYPGADEALDQALALNDFPVVLADSADNAGGGAPSDATFILERVLARGITDVATGPFWDPVAVQLCFEAGEGARIQLRIGGKVAPVSGQPLDLDCEIVALKRDAIMTGLAGTPALLGDVAVVRSQGVTIALTTNRTQAMGTDLFTQFGVDLQAMKLIIVKSSQHFYASYSKVGRHVIYVETPGAITQNYNALPYTKRKLPKWPFTA